MRLPAGAEYYIRRNRPENALDQPGGTGPIFVRHRHTREIGAVTRVTPSGNHIPPQAHVVYGDEESHELWSPLTDLERT